jgi:acetylglutamate kinase
VEEAETLAQGRMKKKVLAAREALAAGVAEVWIRGTTAGATGTRVIA